MATTPATTTSKLTAGMQRLSEAALKAAAQAEGAKQEVRSAKALLKKARKSSKIAKKAAKEAQKKVEAAAGRIKRSEAAAGRARTAGRPKGDKAPPADKSPKVAVAKTSAKADSEAPRTAARKRRNSAAEAARSVIKRLKVTTGAHSPGEVSAEPGGGESASRPVTTPPTDKESSANGATRAGP